MNLRRVPIFPTLIVLIAAMVMVRLGFWQLDRLHQKEALLAQYARAGSLSADVRLPLDKANREAVWFRHTTIECLGGGSTQPMAGHNETGETGWAQWGQCRSADGRTVVEVNAGWSQTPSAVAFPGGTIRGMIAPDGPTGARIVADQPLPGLAASARPDPNDIPNNHLSYAVQWFLFAATALVIYGLALRKRLAATG
ncbi:SURF1 family protein [Novosphingobium sp.]|uniref:SURF1 family protein n=1 Tax=Novosphingobium sp. TaxID=1874826 RepID=UPI0035B46037